MQDLRENEVRPLRLRGGDLLSKLDVVRNKLASSRTMRERSMSTTSLDVRDKTRYMQGSTDSDDPPPYKHSF